MIITLAATNEQRAEVQDLFNRDFVGIEESAVPVIEHDHLYAALLPRIATRPAASLGQR